MPSSDNFNNFAVQKPNFNNVGVDYDATIKSASSLFPKPKAYKPTKAEQNQQRLANNQAYAQQALADFKNLLATNKNYQNGTLTAKANMLDNYQNNTFQNFLNTDPRFTADPDLKRTVGAAINGYIQLEKGRLEDERSWGDVLSRSLGKAGDTAYDMALQIKAALDLGAQNILNNFGEAVHKEAIDKEYSDKLAQLNTELEENSDNPEIQAVIRERMNVAEAERKLKLDTLNADIAKRKRSTQDDAIKQSQEIIREMDKSYKNELERIKSSPAYADLRGRDAELDALYGKDRWGLEGNYSLPLKFADWLVTNAPQLALTTAAGAAGGYVGGAPGAHIAMGLVGGLQSIGAVGQQIFDDILNASDDDLKDVAEYQQVYKSLEGRIADENERKQTAKGILALNAVQEAAPTAVAVGAMLEQFGPEAALNKTVLKSLAGKGIIKRAERGVAAGIGEGVQEVGESAQSIAQTNETLGQDRSWFEDWRQNFLAGFVVGGGLGSVRGGTETTPQATVQNNSQSTTTQNQSQNTATPNAQGTQSTIHGGPTVNENIRAAVMSTDNPFYDPQASINTAEDVAKVSDDLRVATENIQNAINRAPRGQQPKFDDNDILTITSALTNITNSKPANGNTDSTFAVGKFIDSFNENTGLNWTFNDFKRMSTDILARQAQEVAQGVNTNGTNVTTDTGTVTADSETAAVEPGISETAGQQNPESNIGSSTTAQSTGVSRSTRPNTRETVTAVFPNQPASWLAEQGAYSGRDNTVNDATGTQSDIGTGSIAGTTEQRTGNDRRAATVGTAEQTGTNVSSAVGTVRPSDDKVERQELVDNLNNANTFEEAGNAAEALYNYDQLNHAPSLSVAEQTAMSNVSSELRNQVTHTYRSVEYDLEQDRVHAMMEKAMGKENADAVNAATQLYMRMASTLSNIMNRQIFNVLPINDVVVRTVTENNGNVRGRYDKGSKIIELFINSQNDLNSTAFFHELTHAFITTTLDNIHNIQAEARNGNTHAIAFLKDFKDFAKACKVPEGQEFSHVGWDAHDHLGQERAAIAMEHFVVNRDNRERSAELDQLQNNSVVQRMREYFQRAMDTMHAYLFSIADAFTNVRRGNIVSFRKLLDMRRRRGRTWLTWNQQQASGRFDDPELFVYSRANYEYLHFGLPKTISDFFNNVANSYGNIIVNSQEYLQKFEQHPDDYIYAGAEADNDLQASAITNYYITMGVGLFEATRKAAERMHRVMELRMGENPEILIYDDRKKVLDRAAETKPEVMTIYAEGGEAASDYATMELTTDEEMFDISVGMIDPALLAQSYKNSSPDDEGSAVFMSSEVDATLTEEEEAIAVEESINEINEELNNGAMANDQAFVAVDPAFVSYYGGTSQLITNSDGSVKTVYRTGNVIHTNPTGNELETTAYVAVGNVMSDISMIDSAKSSKSYNVISKLYEKAKKAITSGKTLKLTKTEDDALNALGMEYGIWIDSFQFGDDYYILDLNRSSDIFATTKHDDTYELRVAINSQGQPETTQEVYDKLTDVITKRMEANTKAAQQARESRTLDQAAMFSTAMTGSQKANWWMRKVANIRKTFVDEYADFRLFCIEHFTPVVGALESSPWYQSFVMARPRVRGAKHELKEKILRPMQQWIAQVAEEQGKNPQDIAQQMGKLYTYMHTLEAAKRQEQELQRAVITAQMDMSEKRNDKIKQAQDALEAYYKRQDNDPDYKDVPIYGGVTVAEARAEMQKIISELGDDLAEQAVGRFQRAYGDMVQLLIERGVLAEKDVMGFGQWAYYCPLITTTEYTGTITNDVVSLFPAKLNYHRGGSTTPAVDAFSALEYMTRRSANALGSVDLGRESVAAYRILQERYEKATMGQTTKPEEADNITYREEPVSTGLTIKYYGGMGLVPMRVLQELAQNTEISASVRDHASKLIEQCDLLVRVQERLDSENSDVYESVPYAVIFDAQDGRIAKVKKAFADPFRIELDNKEVTDMLDTVGKKMRKITSAFAQMNTTYKPGFPPINAFRDLIERTFYATGKTYRDAMGNPISGKDIAARITKNTGDAPTVMKAIFTGKPEEISGQLGAYLTEFKRQGIMSSASLRGMLEHDTENTYVFVQNAISEFEKGASLKDTVSKLARAGKAPFRTWAEMCYAVPTFSMYKALRESGVSENDAAYYTTEVMNLAQSGKLTNNLANYFPFLTSIGQTSAQLFNYFGLNIGTFGNTRNIKDPEVRKNLARAYLLCGGTAALTAMVLPMIATVLGGGDDDKGWKILDNMSLGSFSFLPFPLGINDYVKVQLGFGPTPFAVQFAIGMNRVMRGADSFGSVIGQLTDSFIRNVVPLAGPDWKPRNLSEFGIKMAQTVTPSIVAPAANAFVYKRNYFGRELASDRYKSPTDRYADVNQLGTEQFFKDVAQMAADHHWDSTPEQWKEFFSGYTPGILAGIREWITSDPLAKDESFAGVREVLGPIGTMMGASTLFGSVGNAEQNLYYSYERTYNDLIHDTGLAKVSKLTDTDKSMGIRAATKRAQILLEAGFDPRIVDDVATLSDLHSRLSNITKSYNKQINDARAVGAPYETIKELYDGMRRERTFEISNTLPMINLYNGALKPTEIAAPSLERIRAVRENR